MKKTFIITFGYALFSPLVCMGISFAIRTLPGLLPGAKTSYVIVRGLLFFFEYAPALILCGFLIGCSIAYGVDSKRARVKYSVCIMTHFRKTMIASIGLVFLSTMISELFVPMCRSYQEREKLKPAVFKDFITLAQSYYDQGKMDLAFEYSYNAVEISPKDKQALYLKEHSAAALNSMKEYKVKAEEPKFVYVPRKESKGETVYSLIQKAQKAMEEENWFDAHYYAYMAVKIGNSKSINLDEAQRLASEAWNHLFDTKIYEETEEQILFRKKRDAYMNFINGDNVEAYYQFLEISKTGDKAARDPDVSKFLTIAESRVNEQCFFIDEVEDLRRFESITNVYFAVPHDDGSKDVVFIRGITPVKNAGRMIQYLRGFTMMTFDNEGYFQKSLYVPYAKMLAQKTDTFDEDSKKLFGIKDEFKTVPYLMLESITKNDRSKRITPVYELDADSAAESDLLNYTVLALPLSDFNLICDAGIGSEKMNLISLTKLLSKARDYGYPWVIYNADFLNRITYPLVLLIAFIFLACIAWNYRMRGTMLFKFKWIFTMPIISSFLYFGLEFLFYTIKLLNFVFVSVAGSGALIISILVLVALLVVTSLIFVSRTGEE
ncbi:MAG: hypothetical protein KBT11_11820 [Treponema sp.]|nr:hypothetical protein [Candidatus Treponema equifaecale]